MNISWLFYFLNVNLKPLLGIDPSYSTILSRNPVLCINYNKSIGAYDHLEFDIGINNNDQEDLDNQSKQQSLRLNYAYNANIDDSSSAASYQSFQNSIEKLSTIFDLILSTKNVKRALEIQLNSLLITSNLNLDWLEANESHLAKQVINIGDDDNNASYKYFSKKSDLVLAWIFYARETLHTSTSNHIEKVLNVLSHALETNPKSELFWLLYLRVYLSKRNSANDYHEVCMLCMDNNLTYDLAWFILNTCSYEFMDLISEKYEKYLLAATNESLEIFEQNFERQNALGSDKRISYYLFELIIFNVYGKLNANVMPRNENNEITGGADLAKQFLDKCLNSSELVNKLEPTDLTILWLCNIHLQTFLHLPSWLSCSNFLMSKVVKNFSHASFWSLDTSTQKRDFNRKFFTSLNYMYRNSILCDQSQTRINRAYDLFLLPWAQPQQNMPKYACAVDKIQNLFHQALRSINMRCPANATSSLALKQEIRLHSLPLFINLINLEVSSKRYETASKMCDRLLKSVDTRMLKELWFTLIYIYRCNNNNSNSGQSDLIEQTVETCLDLFPNDAQVVYVAAQYFSSIVRFVVPLSISQYISISFFFRSI